MKNHLIIKNVNKSKNKIEYIYEANGKWKNLLNLKENFWIEYDKNIEDVPNSIAIIPFLCNILPICWIFNLEIYIDELDMEFYNCIEKVKDGYSEMYPQIEMKGKIIVKEIKENTYIAEKTGALFSGGVDAFNTLFQHMSETPDLLTVWGADIKLDDIEGWQKVKSHHLKVAEQFELKCSFMKTNFRTFINYIELSDYVREVIKGEWWHEFQHGIGILGLVSPIAYIEKYGVIYIASSFTAEYKGKYTCASDPTIDNNLKYASCKIIHDGYEFNRQNKIKNICDYMDENNVESLELRVCWESSGGGNCCECEKCQRTILGIIAEKKDPKKFGFNLTDKKIKEIKKRKGNIKYNFRYLCIQKRLKENYSILETPKDLLWFRKMKIKQEIPNYLLEIRKKKIKFKKYIKKILKL